MLRIYPNNADGDALQRVADHGSDMSQPMSIDFCVAVPDESAGNSVSEVATARGYVTEVVRDDDSSSWTCYCRKEMVPTYDAIIAAQDELDELSKPFGGYSDGWGTLGNSDKLN
jgi:Regulator of ribonuclease activity B